MDYGDSPKPDLSGINKLFFGYLFIFLNLRVNGFDILPDFIGYIFILAGLYSLRPAHEFFSRAMPFGWLSGLISLLDIYQPNYPVGEVPGWLFPYSILVGLFALIINLFLFYYIIIGVSSLLSARGFKDMAAKCKTVWYCFLVARIAGYLFVPAVMLGLGIALLLSIPLIIFNVAIFIMFLILLKRAYRYLS